MTEESILEKKTKVEYEKCVSCDEATEYPIETSIDLREHYVEGAGQLCKTCYDKVYGANPNCCSR